jgi:hypothetical protein
VLRKSLFFKEFIDIEGQNKLTFLGKRVGKRERSGETRLVVSLQK